MNQYIEGKSLGGMLPSQAYAEGSSTATYTTRSSFSKNGPPVRRCDYSIVVVIAKGHTVAYCVDCGAAQLGKFCENCGSVFAKTSGEWPARSSATNVQHLYTAPHAIPVSMQGGVAVNISGTCPSCQASSYTTKYSFSHVLICIFLFPLGLLCLMSPIKRCNQCAHEYGLGKFLRSVVGFIIGLFVLVAIGIGALIALSNSHNVSVMNQSAVIVERINAVAAKLQNRISAAQSTPTLPVVSIPAAQTTSQFGLSSSKQGEGDAVTLDIDSLRRTLDETRQLEILGSSASCDGASIVIRFHDDGTSGCAELSHAIRGTMGSGEGVLLIPLSRIGQGIFADLLYRNGDGTRKFMGILPGDGTGNLSVTIEDGQIVERNNAHIKRSGFKDGVLVEM